MSLQTDQYMIGEAVRLRIIVINGKSKLATDGIKVELHREMKVQGYSSGSTKVDWTNKQCVMKYKWPLVIGKGVPDIVADDYNFVLNKNHV